MTKYEAAVLSAFTGITMCEFSIIHEYIEKVLGRPVFTHEMGSKTFFEDLNELVRPDFLKICESLT